MKIISIVTAAILLSAASAQAGVVLEKRDGSHFTKHEGELVQAEYADYKAQCEKVTPADEPHRFFVLSACIERIYDHKGTNVPNTDVFHD